MWDVPDRERWDHVLSGSHTATLRMELWSNDECLTRAVPFRGGQVTDEWKTGMRRSLTTTLTRTPALERFLDRPSLELRPFRGVRLARGVEWECPLGQFPFLPPERSRSRREPIAVSCNDYMQRVSKARLQGPTVTPGGLIVDRIAWLLQGAGLPAPEIAATSQSRAPSTVVDGERDQAVADSATTISAEVYIDRLGRPVIADGRTLGAPTARLGRLGSVLTPDWSKVYNQVTVETSASGVELAPVTIGITWADHPASPYRLGTRRFPAFINYGFSSPLLMDTPQMLAAAATLLPKVSARSRTVQYSDIPDPSRDAGDTAVGLTAAGWETAQLQTVVTPLDVKSPQVITTVSTLTEAA